MEVRFQDGSVALSTFDETPIRCTLGDGTLSPGIESLLIGLSPGCDEIILADGSELFSAPDPQRIHWLARGDFPADIDPAPGQVIAFETPGGHETSGTVLERDDNRVRVDFNHPLAGRALVVRVQVLCVE